MATKKLPVEKQLLFEFEEQNRKVNFTSHQARCRCGYTGDYRKADIVLEMTVPCPRCGSIIRITSGR